MGDRGAGDRLDEFLDDFPTVTREQAVSLLEHAAKAIRDHDTVVFERQDAEPFLDALVNPLAVRFLTNRWVSNALDRKPATDIRWKYLKRGGYRLMATKVNRFSRQ